MSKYIPFTPQSDNEIWRDIPGYNGLYQVSNLGRIKSLSTHNHKTPIILKTYLSGQGKYEALKLQVQANRGTHYVHDLVANAFIGEKPTGYEVNHIDSNRLNNHADNLEYMTHAENVQYTVKLRRHAHGAKHNWASLSDETINAIKSMKGNHIAQHKVAEIFGVGQSTVGLIWKGKHRKYG